MVSATELSAGFLAILLHSAPRYWPKDYVVQTFSQVEIEYLVETGSVSWTLEVQGIATLTCSQRSTTEHSPKIPKRRGRKPTKPPTVRKTPRRIDLIVRDLTDQRDNHNKRKREEDYDSEAVASKRTKENNDGQELFRLLDETRKEWDPDGRLTSRQIAVMRAESGARVVLLEEKVKLAQLDTLEVFVLEKPQKKDALSLGPLSRAVQLPDAEVCPVPPVPVTSVVPQSTREVPALSPVDATPTFNEWLSSLMPPSDQEIVPLHSQEIVPFSEVPLLSVATDGVFMSNSLVVSPGLCLFPELAQLQMPSPGGDSLFGE